MDFDNDKKKRAEKLEERSKSLHRGISTLSMKNSNNFDTETSFLEGPPPTINSRNTSEEIKSASLGTPSITSNKGPESSPAAVSLRKKRIYNSVTLFEHLLAESMRNPPKSLTRKFAQLRPSNN